MVQLFSPLVTSQHYMHELKHDPYQVIQLEDGSLYVFEMVNKRVECEPDECMESSIINQILTIIAPQKYMK